MAALLALTTSTAARSKTSGTAGGGGGGPRLRVRTAAKKSVETRAPRADTEPGSAPACSSTEVIAPPARRRPTSWSVAEVDDPSGVRSPRRRGRPRCVRSTSPAPPATAASTASGSPGPSRAEPRPSPGHRRFRPVRPGQRVTTRRAWQVHCRTQSRPGCSKLSQSQDDLHGHRAQAGDDPPGEGSAPTPASVRGQVAQHRDRALPPLMGPVQVHGDRQVRHGRDPQILARRAICAVRSACASTRPRLKDGFGSSAREHLPPSARGS